MADQAVPADLKARLKDSYDSIAHKYNEWTIPHSIVRLHYLNQLLNRLPPSTSTDSLSSSSVSPSASTSPSPSPSPSSQTELSILELGCGHGLPVTATLLSHPNTTVAANDLSSTQIVLARRNLLSSPDSNNHTRLTLLEGDMLSLSFPPSTFSAVVAMYSIIHLPRSEQVTMLERIAGWLKPGGWFLANFGEEESEGVQAERWIGEEKGWMFWSGWGREGTVRRMREVGLEVVLEEVRVDEVDGTGFLWVLARKREV